MPRYNIKEINTYKLKLLPYKKTEKCLSNILITVKLMSHYFISIVYFSSTKVLSVVITETPTLWLIIQLLKKKVLVHLKAK